MPLRDHFRPPVDAQVSWEELHGQWPATIVQHLKKVLPKGYVAGPHVHAGSQVAIDVATYEKDDYDPTQRQDNNDSEGDSDGGVATAVWAPAAPSLAVETVIPDFDEYEVRIYDAHRGRRLVAAIEIVSPANKDRPEHRNAFVGKCAALLRNGIAVSIVDLVTTRQFNLYAELLEFLGHSDPTLSDPAPPLYATSSRWITRKKRTILESWSHELKVASPLPILPLWLSLNLAVPLDLETPYEQACHDLWID
jgi:hypothetical protein